MKITFPENIVEMILERQLFNDNSDVTIGKAIDFENQMRVIDRAIAFYMLNLTLTKSNVGSRREAYYWLGIRHIDCLKFLHEYIEVTRGAHTQYIEMRDLFTTALGSKNVSKIAVVREIFQVLSECRIIEV